MVPAPLDFSRLAAHPRTSQSFISGALATSSSPLRGVFELSCRSPLTPCRRSYGPQSRGTDAIGSSSSTAGSSGVAGAFPLSQAPSNTEPAWCGGSSSCTDDDASSRVTVPPTNHPWVIAPSTPALLLNNTRDDDKEKIGTLSAVNIIVGKTLGVGAYTIPSAVFDGVGSVGMSLALWVIGSVISFCGLAVYIDLGTALPRSGGERVYLERIFRSPTMLATCCFMSYVVLLGFSAPNAIVLGEYLLYALGVTPSRWNVRAIAVLAVSALCYIHAHKPRIGLKLINILGTGKIAALAFVVLCGIASGLSGVGDAPTSSSVIARRPDPPFTNAHVLNTAQRNFSDIWSGSSLQPYDCATALLKILYCFRGYSTANQVLSEVKNPVRTLKVAAPIALGIVSAAYFAVNLAFFMVIDKEEFGSSGVVVAGRFFEVIFGQRIGARILPFFIVLTAAGNIAATAFAQARVNEELAKDGLLPWADLWATTAEPHIALKGEPARASNMAPKRGLLLHWLVSIAVIILPPTDRIYNFFVNIGSYPVSVISVAISAGLLYLQLSPSQNWQSPIPARRSLVVIFLFFNSLLLILPWMPPADGQSSDSGFPPYAYPATALAVLATGAAYWCWRRIKNCQVNTWTTNGFLATDGGW
ncbi:amino acid permease-domain-containing protein [Xylariomycetidae sp. FL2044]|nr:amino acid permease-domain-containing protein [Xylariomycetidae sp. FL2044]